MPGRHGPTISRYSGRGDVVTGPVVVAIDLDTVSAPAMRAAIAESDQTGDLIAVWKLLEPQLEQAPHLHPVTVLAMALFTLSMDAARHRNYADEHLFLQTMRENCDSKPRQDAIRSVLLNDAIRQGWWLDEAPYTALAALIAPLSDSHQARLLFAMVRRRETTEQTTTPQQPHQVEPAPGRAGRNETGHGRPTATSTASS